MIPVLLILLVGCGSDSAQPYQPVEDAGVDIYRTYPVEVKDLGGDGDWIGRLDFNRRRCFVVLSDGGMVRKCVR